ncbi:MAG TPA: winged helix DNA-binding domain-containing protein [Gemmatimonadaceae bacterium]|nr:winged helix DNA-binding domain-containing protein [Gemmatimonadaceae bacterium]
MKPSTETSAVTRRRMASQYLTSPAAGGAAAIVHQLGAVQAQDYGGAKWALAQRTRGLSDSDIEADFTAGRILRTHVLRPTWHFVLPADIRWMLALTAPRIKSAMASYDRKLEITADVIRRGHSILTKALDGRHLTRSELARAFEQGGLENATGQRLAHLMSHAELDAIVTSGPRRGKQFTYALMDERAPAVAPIERDAALLELTRRYFATRGPATAHDFAWWSGLSMADVRRALEITRSELSATKLGGQPAWLVEGRLPRMTPSAHLLPNYDEYFIGLKDRSAIAERIGREILVTGGNALVPHVVFVDGQLVGGWRRIVVKDATVVELNLLARLTRDELTRVEAAVKRFEKFLGSAVRLRGGRRRPEGGDGRSLRWLDARE